MISVFNTTEYYDGLASFYYFALKLFTTGTFEVVVLALQKDVKIQSIKAQYHGML